MQDVVEAMAIAVRIARAKTKRDKVAFCGSMAGMTGICQQILIMRMLWMAFYCPA